MEVIDKAISLMYEYKNNKDRLTLLEALHLTEKLLNYQQSKRRTSDIPMDCVACDNIFYSSNSRVIYCPECRAKIAKEKYKNRKAK